MISRILKISFLIGLFLAAAGVGTYLTLTLIIKSEKIVVVPSLKHKDAVQALQMLSGLGLNTRIGSSEYSASVPVNHVIDQDPAPGEEIKKGRNVKLIISMGRLAVTTPDLTGLSIRRALILLEENRLCPGFRTLAYSFDSPENAVMAQAPPPGVTTSRDNCIDLLVSAGRYREQFAMADLTTLPLEDAILEIEAHGLALGDITEAAAPDIPLNRVATHTPPAGFRAARGLAVHLGVNRARADKKKTMTVSGRRQTGFFLYRVPDGLLNRRIKVRINSKYLSYDLFDDFAAPTEELWFFIPRFENVAVMLYEDGELIKTILPGDTL